MIPVSNASTRSHSQQPSPKTAKLSADGRLYLSKATANIFTQYGIARVYFYYEKLGSDRIIWLSDTDLHNAGLEPYLLSFHSGATVKIKRFLNRLTNGEAFYYIGEYTAEQYFPTENDSSKMKSSVTVKLIKIKGDLQT